MHKTSWPKASDKDVQRKGRKENLNKYENNIALQLITTSRPIFSAYFVFLSVSLR
jgi:hypothetical protein